MLNGFRDRAALMVSSLHHPDYRTLWYANMWAGAAAWALIVARGVLVLDLADSSVLVGVTTFAAMIPAVLVPPLAGYLSDRFDRRTVLAWTFIINLFHNLALAVLVIAGSADVWQVVALSLVNGVARAAQMPASQALMPSLVPPSELLNAVALNQATLQGSRLVGPLLIAPVLATVGPGWAFALCTAFYAVGLLQVLRLPSVRVDAADREGGSLAELLAGVKHLYAHPVLRPLTWLVLLHCTLTMSFEAMLPEMSHDVLHIGKAGVSYMMMAVGAGALLGTFLIGGVRDPVWRGQYLWLTGLLSGVTTFSMGVSSSMAVVLTASALMGLTQATFMTLASAIVQVAAPDALRGRIISVYMLHTVGMMAFANLGTGSAAQGVHVLMEGIPGPPVVFMVTGLAFVAVVLASTRVAALAALYEGRGWDGKLPELEVAPAQARV